MTTTDEPGRVRGWFRSRRQLLAELEEAREQCVEATAVLGAVVKERDQARDELVSARRKLDTVTQQRDDAWTHLEAAETGDRVRDRIGSYGPRTPTGELLLERARANALAKRVEELQAANMAQDLHQLVAAQAAMEASS